MKLTPNTVLIGSDSFSMSLSYLINQETSNLEADVNGFITFSSSGVLLLSKDVCESMHLVAIYNDPLFNSLLVHQLVLTVQIALEDTLWLILEVILVKRFANVTRRRGISYPVNPIRIH